MKSTGWGEIPGKDPSRPIGPSYKSDWAITPKTHLKKKGKIELAEEVHRLQTLVRDIAIEFGMERRCAGSGLQSDMHYISNVRSLLFGNHNL